MTYCISEEQRQAHMVFEALAVFVAAPLLVWASTRGRELTDFEKAGLTTVAVTSVAIDGMLLSRYAKMKRQGAA